MKVLVAYATSAAQALVAVELPEGATVAQALAAAKALATDFPAAGFSGAVGVWGRLVDANHRLREGDRVELHRPIRADAKALRRERARLTPSLRRRSAS